MGNIYKTLGLVENNDLIYLVHRDADMKQHIYTYRVEKIDVVDYDDVDALSQEVQGKRLTLGTCLPIGGTSERLMVRAKQVVNIDNDFDALTKQLPGTYQRKINGFVQTMKEKYGPDDTTNAFEIAHQLMIIQEELDKRTNMSPEQRLRMELILEYFVSEIAISYNR